MIAILRVDKGVLKTVRKITDLLKLNFTSKVKIFVLTFSLIIFTVGCIDQNILPCEEATPIGTDITTLLVDDYKCSLRKQAEQDEVTFLIKSRNDLEEWMACGISLPDIDFDEEFIVGGRVKSYECGFLKELITERVCNKIMVTVITQPLICAAIRDVYFFAALPIEYVNHEVEFEILHL